MIRWLSFALIALVFTATSEAWRPIQSQHNLITTNLGDIGNAAKAFRCGSGYCYSVYTLLTPCQLVLIILNLTEKPDLAKPSSAYVSYS